LFGGGARATAVRTAIGQHLNSSPVGLAAASAVGAVVVAADFALVCWDRYLLSIEGRGALAVIALAAQLRLVNGDLASVGLRLTPTQGWWFWGRASLVIGLVVLACLVVGLGAWVLAGRELPLYATPPADIGTAFLRMCLFTPVQEEATYRLALCVPLAVLIGPWGAIVVSGLVFGGLHWAGGTPSPENLVGGFLLAWAYLKSESIAVPVLLHGLGNLCALAAQVGIWYWLRSAV
jgi:membrane protease YdiL (CAAX protease family)